jgi:SPP1 gp7 family putative phage head morphogenesis protein
VTLAAEQFRDRRRSQRRRRTRGRGPRPSTPGVVERRYERALVGLSRELAREINRTIQPYVKAARAAERSDAEINTALFGADFGTLRIRIMRLVREKRIAPIVDQWGREIATWSTREMRRLLAIDLAAESAGVQVALAAARAENVALITSIADRLLGDVFRVVTESVINGVRVETLATQIQERYQVSDSRARLIARDQTLKANAQLTQVRHREAGITSYVWSSSRDERVREIHANLDGFVFNWAEPPITSEDGATNHPGEDYQCRCVAIPVLDPVLD